VKSVTEKGRKTATQQGKNTTMMRRQRRGKEITQQGKNTTMMRR